MARAPAVRERGPGGWWTMTEVEVFYAQRGEAFRHEVVASGMAIDVSPT